MNFWDEKKQKLVKNCPSCSSTFIIDKGTQCSTTCPAKKLEKKYEKIAEKILTHCLPRNKKIRIEFLYDTFLSEKGEIKWGWTNDIRQIIYIPWYTLRSKKEFFDTMAHEIGHVTAYKKPRFLLLWKGKNF